ncbi:MAG: hypothetical protein KQI35_03615 [Bacteroidetes bacterium]|nr:hypothetical protein [Bacteroidota bacterium]
MDFTLKKYKSLLLHLKAAGYDFQTFNEFLENPSYKVVMLRHDVEAKYPHALDFANIQNQLKIKGTYYFRFLRNHYDSRIIKKIADLGHEIGYHYDDLSFYHGDFDQAILRFEKNLETLRAISNVKTICMEGAPMSKYDNRDLWKKFRLQDYGIVGEPYLNIDFNKVYYLTDTGRNWGQQYSVRDKATGNPRQKKMFKSTKEIIVALEQNDLPDQMMITFHPQRWNNHFLPWLWEFFFQNFKNQVKAVLIKHRGQRRP